MVTILQLLVTALCHQESFMFQADGSLVVRSSELDSREPGRRGTQSSTGLQVCRLRTGLMSPEP